MAFIVTLWPAATCVFTSEVITPAAIDTSRPATTVVSPAPPIRPWSTPVIVSRRLFRLFHSTLLLAASYCTPVLITSRPAVTFVEPAALVCVMVPPSLMTSFLAYTETVSLPIIVPCVLRTSSFAITVVMLPLIRPLSF